MLLIVDFRSAATVAVVTAELVLDAEVVDVLLDFADDWLVIETEGFAVLADAVDAWVLLELVAAEVPLADAAGEVVDADEGVEVDAEVGGLVGTVGAALEADADWLSEEEPVKPDKADEATTAALLTIDAVSDEFVELEFASEESAALAETSGSTVGVDVDDEAVVVGLLDAA